MMNDLIFYLFIALTLARFSVSMSVFFSASHHHPISASNFTAIMKQKIIEKIFFSAKAFREHFWKGIGRVINAERFSHDIACSRSDENLFQFFFLLQRKVIRGENLLIELLNFPELQSIFRRQK